MVLNAINFWMNHSELIDFISNNIFQISTEHVLPEQEIKRIGELLSAY